MFFPEQFSSRHAKVLDDMIFRWNGHFHVKAMILTLFVLWYIFISFTNFPLDIVVSRNRNELSFDIIATDYIDKIYVRFGENYLLRESTMTSHLLLCLLFVAVIFEDDNIIR